MEFVLTEGPEEAWRSPGDPHLGRGEAALPPSTTPGMTVM